MDDDKRLASMIEELLPPIEFTSRTAHSADLALQVLEHYSPDIILLDVNLPGVSGFDLCRILKENPLWKKIPIIFISGAARTTDDKVSGFKTGADDYLTKPFEPAELLARIRALLRRTMDASEIESVLREGNLELDLNRRSVSIKNKAIKLTPKEFDLLTIFLRRKGHVLSRSHLLETVWGADAAVSTRTVDVHITSLRAKLGDLGKWIQTESAVGYRFNPSS